MMKNIVVIPCFDRPEFLQICLDYIQQADNSENYEYLFAQDRGAAAQNLNIIAKFPYKSYIVTPEPNRFKIGKQSYNVMNGLLSACSLNPELVFYVEDDVFVGKDFFTFIEEVHAKEKDLFEVICSSNVNSVDRLCDDENGYYIKENTNVHQGIGNCFRAEYLKKYLQPEFCHDYFQNPVMYMQNYYPDSAIGHSFAEQDGLIRRIIERNKLRVAFSHVPRCFHAGFYGYNRNPRLNYKRMNFAQRTELIRQYAFNPELLSGVVQAPNLVTDSLPVNLQTKHTQCKRIELK